MTTDAEIGFRPTRRGPQTALSASCGGEIEIGLPIPTLFRESSISLHHVSAVRAITGAFRQLDNRFGGAHAIRIVARYLDDEIMVQLDSGKFDRGVRTEYLRAAAELNQLAGWMAYDIGSHQIGRRRLRTALELAIEADDDALSAEMLAGLGHHATFFSSAGEAIELYLAAQRVGRLTGIPALSAEVAILRAHGHALEGDVARCLVALTEAERAFALVTNANTPLWLSYFDAAYLAARFARTLRDVGDPVAASEFARNSLIMAEGYERGRMFNTALLATILLDLTCSDEAIHYGRSALGLAQQVGSSRVHMYLREISDRLGVDIVHPGAVQLRGDIARFGQVFTGNGG